MTSITRDRMEKALDFLGETDEEVARLKVNMLRAEYVMKRKEAAAFKSAEGSVADRQSQAKLDADVIAAYDAHTDAMEQYEIVAAKRKTEALVIEVFRTVEASRRAAS